MVKQRCDEKTRSVRVRAKCLYDLAYPFAAQNIKKSRQTIWARLGSGAAPFIEDPSGT